MLSIYRAIINLKNGQNSKKSFIYVSSNSINISLLNILWEEGFINGFSSKNKKFKVFLKYNNSNSLISYVRFFSKPSMNVYITSNMLWKLNDKLGVFVLSTDKGLLSLKECKRSNLGGILCFFLK